MESGLHALFNSGRRSLPVVPMRPLHRCSFWTIAKVSLLSVLAGPVLFLLAFFALSN